jgi:hypothetical protein
LRYTEALLQVAGVVILPDGVTPLIAGDAIHLRCLFIVTLCLIIASRLEEIFS